MRFSILFLFVAPALALGQNSTSITIQQGDPKPGVTVTMPPTGPAPAAVLPPPQPVPLTYPANGCIGTRTVPMGFPTGCIGTRTIPMGFPQTAAPAVVIQQEPPVRYERYERYDGPAGSTVRVAGRDVGYGRAGYEAPVAAYGGRTFRGVPVPRFGERLDDDSYHTRTGKPPAPGVFQHRGPIVDTLRRVAGYDEEPRPRPWDPSERRRR